MFDVSGTSLSDCLWVCAREGGGRKGEAGRAGDGGGFKRRGRRSPTASSASFRGQNLSKVRRSSSNQLTASLSFHHHGSGMFTLCTHVVGLHFPECIAKPAGNAVRAERQDLKLHISNPRELI